MRIAFYGSSLLSSYWNGAATYYRGLLSALAELGHDITFYEPDAFDRQQHRDIEPPPWAKVEVYPATMEAVRRVTDAAAAADVVVKASGVGVFDVELLDALAARVRPGALLLFWDVDAPATIAELRREPTHPARRAFGRLDLVLTYGGGPPVVSAYQALGAKRCVPIYNALDPATHFPVAPERRFAGDLGLLANRLPDREARIEAFFLEPARRLVGNRFLLGGAGWGDKALPANMSWIGHVYTAEHNAFNSTPRAILNVARDSMAEIGYSPATRVFEAAGAAACLITDAWTGIELFLAPGEEVLVARDGRDVSELLAGLTADRAKEIGARARARILAQHTYRLRAVEVDRLLKETAAAKRQRSAA